MSDGAASLKKRPLDDVMLAMDVVDTLRHRRKLVARELDETQRDEQLLERLRKIYTAQGIEVPDHILREGVAALKEERFVYKPPPDTLATRLARLYVSRERWGKWLLGAFAGLLLAVVGYYFGVIAPRTALPAELEAMHESVVEVAQTDEAKDSAMQLYLQGLQALRDGEPERAREDLQSLAGLRTALEQQYTLRIVNRPGERSGVWRIPDLNPSARNYYLIVEAIDSDGRRVPVDVTSEETGKTSRVETWGLRVDREVFEQVAADKQDDGIIQNNRFGIKRRGHLRPDYALPTTGAAITRW
ncbi:MAG: DUF6384 family protein [Thiohalobacterales bacterium]|nr:DUF6384 family protein [Thiohalobacterales bacterium]